MERGEWGKGLVFEFFPYFFGFGDGSARVKAIILAIWRARFGEGDVTAVFSRVKIRDRFTVYGSSGFFVRDRGQCGGAA